MLAWDSPDTASRGCATRFGGAGATPFPDQLSPVAITSGGGR